MDLLTHISMWVMGSAVISLLAGYHIGKITRFNHQADAATKKDLVKPREGVRLVEFYEEQMRSKTYLNIERLAKKGASKKKA